MYDGGDGDVVAAVRDGHHEFHVAIVYFDVDFALLLNLFSCCCCAYC